jgi:ABC-type glutathione transport system ATPase component
VTGAVPVPVMLRTRKLVKEYRASVLCVEALRAVDIELAFGEFVAVMGSSGSGKSTLLHVIGGLATVRRDGRRRLVVRVAGGARVPARSRGTPYATLRRVRADLRARRGQAILTHGLKLLDRDLFRTSTTPSAWLTLS